MEKKIYILDYEGKKTEVEIEDFDNVKRMTITVLSGDEVLDVVYKNGTTRRYDSSDCRWYSYYDCEYDIYEYDETENPIDDPEWLNRKKSYDCLDW